MNSYSRECEKDQELKAISKILTDKWGEKAFDQRRLDLLFRRLKKFSSEAFEKACDFFIEESRFTPTNSEIVSKTISFDTELKRMQSASEAKCKACDDSGWVIPNDCPESKKLEFKKRCKICTGGYAKLSAYLRAMGDPSFQKAQNLKHLDDINDFDYRSRGYSIRTGENQSSLMRVQEAPLGSFTKTIDTSIQNEFGEYYTPMPERVKDKLKSIGLYEHLSSQEAPNQEA